MLGSLQAIAEYRRGDAGAAERHIWLRHIVSAEERIVNMERIGSIQELAEANPVLDYVERSLRCLERLPLSFWIKEIIEEVLVWAETAKGGTARDRLLWQQEGINLFVHNEGSAQLYRKSLPAHNGRTGVVGTLIATHGLIGQVIRGEVPHRENAPLTELVRSGMLSEEECSSLLLPLNQCIISAVSESLWEAVKAEAAILVRQVAAGAYAEELPLKERLRKLRSAPIRAGEDFDNAYGQLASRIELDGLAAVLANTTLWFVEPALQDFSFEQFAKVLLLTVQDEGVRSADVRHISFEPLMNTMYYDYKGSKKINVYKKRIIEKYLNELPLEAVCQGAARPASPHLRYALERKSAIADTVFVRFEFSAAAEKLIDFCVEAEKSPLYEKAVLLLFDLFELRRDAYDRFHNEADYLAAMNQSVDYKKRMLDYIVGKRVVDIGPGGGVMLDLIERHLPGKLAIGIDISANVIEALERKKQLEGHSWEVRKGDALNLKDYLEPGSIDTVIFSSILHELYSYIEFNGKKFNRATVAAALRSAFDVLAPGGRIVIRDGIMTEPADQQRTIRFLQPESMEWLRRYAKDFAGRPIQYEVLSADEARMPVNDAMEFLYTFTWGEEAYVHEVQEQFGYFTPSEYNAFIGDVLGAEAVIVESVHFLQEGYTEALSDKIVLTDDAGCEAPLPDSTCLIVIEKK